MKERGLPAELEVGISEPSHSLLGFKTWFSITISKAMLNDDLGSSSTSLSTISSLY